jgi:hypothetical protein
METQDVFRNPQAHLLLREREGTDGGEKEGMYR